MKEFKSLKFTIHLEIALKQNIFLVKNIERTFCKTYRKHFFIFGQKCTGKNKIQSYLSIAYAIFLCVSIMTQIYR